MFDFCRFKLFKLFESLGEWEEKAGIKTLVNFQVLLTSESFVSFDLL